MNLIYKATITIDSIPTRPNPCTERKEFGQTLIFSYKKLIAYHGMHRPPHSE